MANATGQARIAVSQAELASIVESSHDAIVGMTRSGLVRSCNPAAARLYGYAPDELLAQPVEVLVPAERRMAEAAVLRSVLAGAEVAPYSTNRLRRDGTVIAVSLTISPIVDATGTIVGAASASRRASDLQEAQDRFEVLVDWQRSEAHDAADRFDEQVDQQRAEAQGAADRFEDQVDQQRAEAQGAAERLEQQVDQQRSAVHDAADRFDEQVVAERVQAANAQDRFHVRMDAERAEAQGDKEHLQGQLQQAQRLEVLGQLAGGVAHDFNNLLAVILNYAAFVAEELSAAPALPGLAAAARDVGQIQRAAERATGLTHQLLAFARRDVVQPRVLDLNDIVTDVQQLLDRTIGTDVVLQTELAPDLWPVLADTGQLEQVLVNLAVNARDAMSGGGTLIIDTANITLDADTIPAGSPLRPGRHVRLRVSDSGTGMPADIVEHVFEPFFTTKLDGTGTGLGLATVYGIVTQAEGGITIHSQPGVGTTFRIMIPATDEIALPIADPPPYHRAPKGETVLVAEDEEALRKVTERIFARSGYHVITVANGPEAIAVAAQHEGKIHLLLTDVVMPNMLGKEVAARIRQTRPDTEVLYMSGYAQPVLASQGRLDSDVNLIEKPFSASALIKKAGEVLNGRFKGFHPVEPDEASPPAKIDGSRRIGAPAAADTPDRSTGGAE